MYSETTTIQNITGLHARPASVFIACAAKYKSRITIKRVGGDEQVNAKSIVMLLTLALNKGSEVEICAEGEDEREAVKALVCLIESKFNESD